jgi:hypothetical protein
VRTSQQRWTVMIYCFRIRVELQPLSWKEVHFKTLLIDGMEMLMALVVDSNPSSYLLENFLQQALWRKSEKMDFIAQEIRHKIVPSIVWSKSSNSVWGGSYSCGRPWTCSRWSRGCMRPNYHWHVWHPHKLYRMHPRDPIHLSILNVMGVKDVEIYDSNIVVWAFDFYNVWQNVCSLYSNI